MDEVTEAVKKTSGALKYLDFPPGEKAQLVAGMHAALKRVKRDAKRLAAMIGNDPAASALFVERNGKRRRRG